MDTSLGMIEAKFADLIWESEPIASGELVKRAYDALGWKKSTTYTVLRRLCERGIFINDNGIVTSLINRADFYAMQSEKFVDERFEGSLPGFIAAFASRKKLGKKEIEALQKLIDDSRREEDV
ncbi:MAG: BlaI/MecI/CopY family transcriptional regulator [Clostridia bacterium]|nr:BlaI/MecI/CopY family transcriptional regulator [Clostridia bacterium]